MRRAALLSLSLLLFAGCGTPPAERGLSPATSSAAPPPSAAPASSASAVGDGEPASASQDPAPDGAGVPAPQGEREAAPDRAAAEVAEALARTAADSVSIGAPGDGRVEGALALPLEGPGFIHNDKRPREARYGTVELVQAIMRAAAVVDRELPGSRLVVNDLGLEGGGPIAQHGSHQAGRDADILFYVLDKAGEPLRSVGVPIDPDGMGWDFKELPVVEDDVRVRIDLPRTWRFMQALVEEAGDHIQRIFIVEHVRTMLLAHAERVRAPAAARERFAMVSCQPGTPHDDHIHLRLYCSPDDIAAGCLDKPPVYPWHKQALGALGLAPVMEKVGRRDRKARDNKVASRTTTRAQARARAGPMHGKVRAFLDEREQWAKMPHPGRPYCR